MELFTLALFIAIVLVPIFLIATFLYGEWEAEKEEQLELSYLNDSDQTDDQ